MDNLKKLLNDALSRHRITKQVKAATVCSTWKEVSAEVLPQPVAAGAEVISFREGTLKIGVPGPSFSQAIKYSEVELKDKLNNKLGKKLIERIKPQVV